MSPDDIDKLTIAEVRAICERAESALRTLNELGLAQLRPPVLAARGIPTVIQHNAPVVAAASPYPCPGCGRTAVEKLGEPASPIECQLCGNHLPLEPGAQGVRMTNKGPLVMDADMLARRQALIAQPAFGPDGEPT